MKKLLLVLFLFSTPAFATVYYVDETATGASNSNNGLFATYSSGVNGPWLTIGKCPTVIVAGDTCTVLPGGSYDEIVTETTSGTIGNRITYVATGSPRAIVRAFKFTSTSYITIDGFEITATGMGAGASICFAGQTPQICVTGTTPTGVQILNNNIHDTAVSAVLLGNPVDLIFRGNTINTVPSGNICVQINTGNGVLIENNSFLYCPDYIAPTGTKFVVRNNIAGPANPAEVQHMDFVQTNATASYVLIEGNTFVGNVSSDNHFFLNQATSSDNWIARYNTIYQSKGGVLLGGAQKIYLYNNTFYRINDYVTSNFMLSYCTLAGNCNSSSGRISSVFARNNIWYASGTSSCTTPNVCIYSKGAGANVIDKDYDNRYLSGDPLETHQLNADPMFTDAASGDFTLMDGSTSINAGGALTTVAVADTGSGTSLVLTDASAFQDGWAGATADVIAVGTVGNTAAISSIDYATNIVTLASGVTRSDGDSVWLYSKSDGVVILYGTAPDIGSQESGAPAIVSMSPNNGAEGATVSVTITGTGFEGGNAVVTVSGSNVTVSNTVIVSNTSITADFAIDAAAAVGARNVTVTTDEGASNTSTFTVNCTSTSLAFTAQPSSAGLSQTLGTVSVAVRCGDASTNTASSASIVIAKDGSATWSALTTASSLTKLATSGVATWTDLTVTPTIGAGSITAASSGLTGATSNSITISSPPSITRGSRVRARAH